MSTGYLFCNVKPEAVLHMDFQLDASQEQLLYQKPEGVKVVSDMTCMLTKRRFTV